VHGIFLLAHRGAVIKLIQIFGCKDFAAGKSRENSNHSTAHADGIRTAQLDDKAVGYPAGYGEHLCRFETRISKDGIA
jgi:hypothetical protein